ncbi:chromate transporter [Methylocella sp.]|uniref:chromate transporter n=1 Tax=Methylocella sp. TaxID=1978226 RepID=UPI0037841AF7
MDDAEDRRGEAAKLSRRDLFLAFFKIGLVGFGGVAAWVQRVLVDERGFMSLREFAETQGVASALPGANTVNLSVMLGDRHHGLSGALAALSGLFVAPLAILTMILVFYDRLAELTTAQGALQGAAAATSGLVIANAFRLLRAIGGDRVALLVAAAVFAAVGLFAAPLVAVLICAIPASVAAFALTRAHP